MHYTHCILYTLLPYHFRLRKRCSLGHIHTGFLMLICNNGYDVARQLSAQYSRIRVMHTYLREWLTGMVVLFHQYTPTTNDISFDPPCRQRHLIDEVCSLCFPSLLSSPLFPMSHPCLSLFTASSLFSPLFLSCDCFLPIAVNVYNSWCLNFANPIRAFTYTLSFINDRSLCGSGSPVLSNTPKHNTYPQCIGVGPSMTARKSVVFIIHST